MAPSVCIADQCSYRIEYAGGKIHMAYKKDRMTKTQIDCQRSKKEYLY